MNKALIKYAVTALLVAPLCGTSAAAEEPKPQTQQPGQMGQMGGMQHGSMGGGMGGMMGNMPMMNDQEKEDLLKKVQEQELKLHDLSRQILESKNDAETERLKAEHRKVMKEQIPDLHKLMMQEHMQMKHGQMQQGQMPQGQMQHGQQAPGGQPTPQQGHSMAH